MKAVILAGGMGSRIIEESASRPKPMIEIGGRPLLWHIMKIFDRHGIRDFVICLGYKGHVIKAYFLDYFRNAADLTVDLAGGACEIHRRRSEEWKVTLVETGRDTLTGGRLKRAGPYLAGTRFMMTYGDGLSDIDIGRELEFHRRHGRIATVAAVQPPGRFGRMDFDADGLVTRFEEKPEGEYGWINGGFFVFEPEALSRLEDDSPMLERDLLPRLAGEGQIVAYRHSGYWMSCDTMRDKLELERTWSEGTAPWLAGNI
ncbi:MAG: glucose-1-phosphate cytidylyltransferase [Planctomycetota bacterium]|nr:glucose-1-phosphate cytidylyltransferase [Planctomycetota bacterium]